MAKPRLVKVRALFYVFQHVYKKEAASILTQPLLLIFLRVVLQHPVLYANWRRCVSSWADIEVIDLLDPSAPWRDLQGKLAR